MWSSHLLCLFFSVVREVIHVSTVELEPAATQPWPSANSSIHRNQIDGFKDAIISGPIVAPRYSQLFIPNVRYGGYGNVSFRIGNTIPPEWSMVVDVVSSSSYWHPFDGENLYLNTMNATVEDINYIEATNEEYRLGIVMFDDLYPQDGRAPEETGVRMMVPKCCPFNFTVGRRKCEANYQGFKPEVVVFNHTEEEFDDTPVSSVIVWTPYVYPISCSFGRIFLDNTTEDYAILMNGSLLVNGNVKKGILSHGEFCLDSIGDSETKIFICASPPEQGALGYGDYIYVVVLSLSTVGYIITIIFYRHTALKRQYIYRKCLLAYALGMYISFFLLILMHFFRIGCEGAVGFILQISVTLSYVSYAVLCFDLAWTTHYYALSASSRRRLIAYISCIILTPAIFLIPSFVNNFTPDIPSSFLEFGGSSCNNENINTCVFYIPTGLSSFVALASLIYTRVISLWYDKQTKSSDIEFWLTEKKYYTNMFVRYFILWKFMCLWLCETAISPFLDNAGILFALRMVHASQGIVLFCILYNEKICIRRRKRINDISEIIDIY